MLWHCDLYLLTMYFRVTGELCMYKEIFDTHTSNLLASTQNKISKITNLLKIETRKRKVWNIIRDLTLVFG
uniref:Uncharacterized protein n=1 Tax=Noccaea caerulescens TaxID=107243 RepID=A0A1J3K0Y2_NOCCA